MDSGIGDLQTGMLQSVRFLLHQCRAHAGVGGRGTAAAAGGGGSGGGGVSVYGRHGAALPHFSSSSGSALDAYADIFADSNPLCKVLYGLLKNRERVWGDGGWLCCFVCARLIELGGWVRITVLCAAVMHSVMRCTPNL
jgi:hypothetical protein